MKNFCYVRRVPWSVLYKLMNLCQHLSLKHTLNSTIMRYSVTLEKKITLNALYSEESTNPGIKAKISCKLSSSIIPFFSPEADNPDQYLR